MADLAVVRLLAEACRYSKDLEEGLKSLQDTLDELKKESDTLEKMPLPVLPDFVK